MRKYDTQFCNLLEKLLHGEVRHGALGWLKFEEAIAELIEKDGHKVILGAGRKNGGKDILAEKEVEEIGPIVPIWQAKKLSPVHKVALGVIRELADTCRETPATKDIMVTTTHLTRDALLRVQKDRFMLSKRDQEDLLRWLQRIKKQNAKRNEMVQ
jgi:HJR/Mrr/RecB family endonuclease